MTTTAAADVREPCARERALHALAGKLLAERRAVLRSQRDRDRAAREHLDGINSWLVSLSDRIAALRPH